MIQTSAYAAIRKTDDREWIDTNTLGLLAEEARQAARDTDMLIPLYATNNPVQRIVKVKVIEVTP